MLEGLALALLKTLATYMFEGYLHSTDEVKIDGAPGWFYVQEDDQMCAFSYTDGSSPNSIERAKATARVLMKREIEALTERTVYKNVRNVSGSTERRIVKEFSNDRNLPTMIRVEMRYPKISYEDEVNRVFVKGCIPKTTIYNYEKENLKNLTKELSIHRSQDQFRELQGGASSNRYFQELESDW
jgi:hypothetical protein